MEKETKQHWHLSTRRILAILFLAAVGCGVGYFIVKDRQRAADMERRAYEMLDSTDNPLWYEDFILRFPESDKLGEVQQRYKDLLHGL